MAVPLYRKKTDSGWLVANGYFLFDNGLAELWKVCLETACLIYRLL